MHKEMENGRAGCSGSWEKKDQKAREKEVWERGMQHDCLFEVEALSRQAGKLSYGC